MVGGWGGDIEGEGEGPGGCWPGKQEEE